MKGNAKGVTADIHLIPHPLYHAVNQPDRRNTKGADARNIVT